MKYSLPLLVMIPLISITSAAPAPSLGDGYSRALNQAVDGVIKSGLHFSVAAGNDDSDSCDYLPGSAEPTVTVPSEPQQSCSPPFLFSS